MQEVIVTHTYVHISLCDLVSIIVIFKYLYVRVCVCVCVCACVCVCVCVCVHTWCLSPRGPGCVQLRWMLVSSHVLLRWLFCCRTCGSGGRLQEPPAHPIDVE